MTMTTDEARTRWCPFARSRVVRWDKSINTVENGAWLGPVEAKLSTACIADACMAWRWHLSPKRIAVAKALVAAGNATSHEQSFAVATPAGYCGLAGAIGLD